MDLALKIAWIVDLCDKLSRLADFENTVDRGSAVIFDVDSRLSRCYGRILGPKQNLDHRSFFNLGWYVNELIQIIYSKEVHFNSGVRLLLELYCVVVIKHVAFFTIWAKIINNGIHIYRFTFEPLYFYFRMWLWFRI